MEPRLHLRWSGRSREQSLRTISRFALLGWLFFPRWSRNFFRDNETARRCDFLLPSLENQDPPEIFVVLLRTPLNFAPLAIVPNECKHFFFVWRLDAEITTLLRPRIEKRGSPQSSRKPSLDCPSSPRPNSLFRAASVCCCKSGQLYSKNFLIEQQKWFVFYCWELFIRWTEHPWAPTLGLPQWCLGHFRLCCINSHVLWKYLLQYCSQC